MENTEQSDQPVRKKTLWCPRCQHGPANRGGIKKFSPGDECPECVIKAQSGQIAPHDIAKLWDGAEHAAHKVKMGELKKLQRLEKAMKAPKTMDDVKHEVQAEFQAKIDAQAQEISELRKLINSQKSAPAQTKTSAPKDNKQAVLKEDIKWERAN